MWCSPLSGESFKSNESLKSEELVVGDSLVSGVRALPQPERATAVGSVAEALHHIAGAMSDTQVMTVGERIVGWVGESAGAFAHEARHIQAAVRKV